MLKETPYQQYQTPQDRHHLSPQYAVNINNDSLAPKLELKSFDCDPMNYHSFVKRFKGNVMSTVSFDKVRLTFLLQLQNPDVRKKIEHFLRNLMPSD